MASGVMLSAPVGVEGVILPPLAACCYPQASCIARYRPTWTSAPGLGPRCRPLFAVIGHRFQHSFSTVRAVAEQGFSRDVVVLPARTSSSCGEVPVSSHSSGKSLPRNGHTADRRHRRPDQRLRQPEGAQPGRPGRPRQGGRGRAFTTARSSTGSSPPRARASTSTGPSWPRSRRRSAPGSWTCSFAEDLGRWIRGAEAVRLCGIAVDHGTRVIAPNDCIDTAEATWEEDVISACRDHVGHNAHTSKRLKQKLMNRFLKCGGATAARIYGYDQARRRQDLRRVASRTRRPTEIYAEWFRAAARGPELHGRGGMAEPQGRPRREIRPPQDLGRGDGAADHGEHHAQRHARPRVPAHRQAPRERPPGLGPQPEGSALPDYPHLAFFEPEYFDEVNALARRGQRRLRPQARQRRGSAHAGPAEADAVPRPARLLPVLRPAVRLGRQRHGRQPDVQRLARPVLLELDRLLGGDRRPSGSPR